MPLARAMLESKAALPPGPAHISSHEDPVAAAAKTEATNWEPSS